MAADVASKTAENVTPDACNPVSAVACCDQAQLTLSKFERLRIAERAALYCRDDAKFADLARGLSVIEHSDLTQERVYELAERLARQGAVPSDLGCSRN